MLHPREGKLNRHTRHSNHCSLCRAGARSAVSLQTTPGHLASTGKRYTFVISTLYR